MVDVIDRFVLEFKKAAICIPLLNRRLINVYRPLAQKIAEHGIAFNVNPRDDSINKDGEAGIKQKIIRAFENRDIKGKCMYMLIPEYNTDRHKLHYHGVCIVRDYKTLTRIKRTIARNVGRCESNNIDKVEGWLDYMFKSYAENEIEETHIETLFIPENVVYPPYLNIVVPEE